VGTGGSCRLTKTDLWRAVGGRFRGDLLRGRGPMPVELGRFEVETEGVILSSIFDSMDERPRLAVSKVVGTEEEVDWLEFEFGRSGAVALIAESIRIVGRGLLGGLAPD